FVIDCDTREGYQAIQKHIPENLLFPMARTPRDGWHLWFVFPGKFTVGVNVIPGVDFRGEGGYIITPPSVNGTGKAYAWAKGLSLDDVQPPEMPDALQGALA